ncbi:hypothetical protein TNCV_3324601 [Trichonephila clavipes]|nr:hypothetical protein TNCV_3324601 [Trichonephila clavipes]
MMWFVREEFLWGPLSSKASGHFPFSLSLSLPSLASALLASLDSSYIRLVGGRKVPRGVKGCRVSEASAGWRSRFVTDLVFLMLRVRPCPKSVGFHDAENRHRPYHMIIRHVKDPRVPVLDAFDKIKFLV